MMNILFSRRKICGVLIAFFIAYSASAATRGAQELIKAGHWVYDAFKEISLECGLVNFADSTPISIQQLKLYMSEIDEEKLSESGKRQLERINSYISESNLSYGYDIVSVGIEPSLSFEGFYKSEDDIDWVWDRYERKPMLDVPFTITVGDYVTMSMDTILSQNKGASLHNDNYTNIFYNPDDFDINFPDTAYFSTGKMLTDKAGFSFQIGRGSRNVGDTSALCSNIRAQSPSSTSINISTRIRLTLGSSRNSSSPCSKVFLSTLLWNSAISIRGRFCTAGRRGGNTTTRTTTRRA